MRLALSPGMPSQQSCGGFFIAVAPSTAHPSDRTINGHGSVMGAPQVTLRSRPAPGWARPRVIGTGMAADPPQVRPSERWPRALSGARPAFQRSRDAGRLQALQVPPACAKAGMRLSSFTGGSPRRERQRGSRVPRPADRADMVSGDVVGFENLLLRVLRMPSAVPSRLLELGDSF